MADDVGTQGPDAGPFGTPQPQKAARARKAVKKTAATPSVQVVSVAESIAMVYRLFGDVARQRELPATGQKLSARSAEFGAAWDKFLQRFPALYEMMEKGTIASDVIVLVMLHVDVVQTANREIEARNEWIARNGGGGEPAAA